MISILAKQLFTEVREHLPSTQKDSAEITSRLKQQIESTLQGLNIVSRQEYEAQTEVLKRTQEKLETLNLQVKEMEKIVSKS